MTSLSVLAALAAGAVAWYAAAPAVASAMAMVLSIAVVTFLALPSAWAAACVMATSCATGCALPGSLPSAALASAQLGALAYLMAGASRAAGLADTAWAATALGAISAAILAAVVLRHAKAAAPTNDAKK